MLHINNFYMSARLSKIVDIYFHTWKNFQSTKNYSQLSNWNNLHLIKCICCLMRMYRFGNNMIITNYFSDSFISYLRKSSAIFLQKLNLKQNLFYRRNGRMNFVLDEIWITLTIILWRVIYNLAPLLCDTWFCLRDEWFTFT